MARSFQQAAPTLKASARMLLQWWMRLVGLFYLFHAGALLPFGTGPGRAAPAIPWEQQYAQRMEDWQFLFALEIGVLGVVLLYAAQRPRDNTILVWLVVMQEAVRGVLGMAYFITRGAPAAVYGLLLFAHLLVVGSGIDFVRRAMREPNPNVERA